jgi:hypothetical protein
VTIARSTAYFTSIYDGNFIKESNQYHDEYHTAERHSARLTVVEHAKSNEDALKLLRLLGLDSYEIPRDLLPLRKP